MNGYKALRKDFTNRYGTKYEIGVTYRLNGELKWGSNGFHFCKMPEDTFRYVDGFNDEIIIVEVIGNDQILEYYDDYNGYYDMYSSSEFKILREVPREEYINMIISSNNPERVKRLIQTLKLTDEEINIIKEKYNDSLDFCINYYQKNIILKK